MIQHFNIVVHGKVQGVFFRKTTQDKARELGVKGKVKNMPDGSVYIEAEAEHEKLRDFILWCRKGPLKANVKKLELREGKFMNYSDFDIEE
jgi:acylphosphatase